MKKFIGLGIAVAVVVGLIASGTWALFTDTEENDSPNTFTAGIIDLVLDQDSTVVTAGEFVDLKPCQTGYLVVKLSAATGSNPMHVWKHIRDITENDLDENLVTDAEQKWYDDTNLNPSGEPKNDIDRYIHFDMWTQTQEPPPVLEIVPPDPGNAAWIIEESDNWLLSNNVVDFPIPSTEPAIDYNKVTSQWIYLGILDPMGFAGPSDIWVVQSFHLDRSVENWAQSDKLTFTEEFFALQTVGDDLTSDDAPGDELPGHESPLPEPEA